MNVPKEGSTPQVLEVLAAMVAGVIVGVMAFMGGLRLLDVGLKDALLSLATAAVALAVAAICGFLVMACLQNSHEVTR